jgi:GTPase SAR1 family protein
MYAELVCGPPGSGKTTYCEGRRQFLTMQGRHVVTINLDPANDGIFPYPCDIDVTDLVSHEAVMVEETLGPNGAYLYCIEYISLHLDWLVDQVKKQLVSFEESDATGPFWILIDCPGQVEYYLHSDAMQKIVNMIQRVLRFNLCVVHLCDAAIATRDVSTYVATCLLALSTMTDLELPHLNILTKWDTIVKANRQHADPERQELFHGAGTHAHEEMEPYLDTPSFLDDHFRRLWKEQHGTSASDANPRCRMAKALLEVIDDYSLVSFLPLDIEDGALMTTIGEQIDAAVGHFH